MHEAPLQARPRQRPRQVVHPWLHGLLNGDAEGVPTWCSKRPNLGRVGTSETALLTPAVRTREACDPITQQNLQSKRESLASVGPIPTTFKVVLRHKKLALSSLDKCDPHFRLTRLLRPTRPCHVSRS
jgi:hypothetical protein